MIDLLSIYNAGLRAIGGETLVDLTENVEAKVHLDQIWDYDALGAALKLARPDFARRTVALTGTASTHPSHAFEFALPDNHLATLRDADNNAAYYADANLDQITKRYLREGGALYADVPTLYVRYVARIEDFTEFTPDFLEVLSAYLGMQLAPRIAPDMVEQLQIRLNQAVQTTAAIGAEQWSSDRPTAASGTLTDDWMKIYCDAVQMLGATPLTGADDDSEMRVQLDIARKSGAIDAILDDTGWGFARKTIQIHARDDLEPAWGHGCVFPKPEDFLRLRGVFTDEHMTQGLREYKDEGACIFADCSPIYLEYVPNTLVDDPAAWPPYFRKFAAAELANRVKSVKSLYIEPNVQLMVMAEHEKRDGEARSTDAMQNPPRIIRAGSWTKSRYGYGYSGRRGGQSGRF